MRAPAHLERPQADLDVLVLLHLLDPPQLAGVVGGGGEDVLVRDEQLEHAVSVPCRGDADGDKVADPGRREGTRPFADRSTRDDMFVQIIVVLREITFWKFSLPDIESETCCFTD